LKKHQTQEITNQGLEILAWISVTFLARNAAMTAVFLTYPIGHGPFDGLLKSRNFRFIIHPSQTASADWILTLRDMPSTNWLMSITTNLT
jgi:hypothetical protein